MSYSPANKRPGAMLVVADFHGTLAAVRSLGRAGIDVCVADWRKLVPARWSRFATRTLTCPDPSVDPHGFIAWLLEAGADDPGRVLIPTTDDLVWLFARHASELSKHFVVDAPPLDTVYTLLNKWRLKEACAAAGVDTPETWLPNGELDAGAFRFPLLIKPQTQTLLSPHQKGRVVRARSQLRALYDDFKKATRHAGALLAVDPRVSQPLLQQLVETRGIYGLSGFIDSTGELFVVSAARKVLQKPQVLGVGLCFQQAELNVELAETLRRLCRSVGYHGLFEVEFLEEHGKHLLIDFNPRLYGQIGFDMARGADLPLIAYLHAIGDRAGLKAEVEAALARFAGEPSQAWCDRINLEGFMKLRMLSGAITRSNARTWAGWLEENQPHLTDAVIDEDDLVPALVSALSLVWTHVSHPRATWRAVRER